MKRFNYFSPTLVRENRCSKTQPGEYKICTDETGRNYIIVYIHIMKFISF